MTDADKLRRLGRELDEVNADQRGVERAPIYPGDPELLRRIASLLDAVPPETLASFGKGEIVAVNRSVVSTVLGWLQGSLGGKPSWGCVPYADAVNAARALRAALSAAPTKPEGREKETPCQTK